MKMKNLRKQNPIVLALAIIGIGAVAYGGWTIYQHHVVEEEQQAIISAPPSTPLSGLFKPSEKPPPQ
jgi:predicted negative regulator of RcsB-dependent stress response